MRVKPFDLSRLVRLRQHYEYRYTFQFNMKVTPFERDVYLVESQGTSGEGIEYYRVDLSNQYFGCSCKDYQFRRAGINLKYGLNEPCKHIIAAQRYVKNHLTKPKQINGNRK